MIELLKRIKWVLLLLAVPYGVAVFLFTYRIDFSLVTPGGLEQVSDQVVFETMYDAEGSFHTIYVMAIDRPTFFQLMVSYFDRSIDYSILPESRRGVSDAVNWRSGQLARDNAWNAAIITAYQALGLDVEYEVQQRITLIYDYISNDEIDLGDHVVMVNGHPLVDEEGRSLVHQVIGQTTCGETHTFTVRTEAGVYRDHEILKQDINGQCRFGLSLSTYYHLVAVEMPYEVKPTFVGGPSGGIMQFLHMYNVLTEQDATQGLKVAGTGTIQLDGSVGPIGGVKQKVITAHRAGVDILFVPRLNDSSVNDNYQVALRTMETLDTSMRLVGVSSWLEAVTYLLALETEDEDV
ncbi:MAG: hypothetical protein EA374_02660 [Acholeplasmatales bacterium]|nr:MAG: hypothetical protein EA374_02660 [Acholeplasmatales bacterium]